MIDRPFVVLCGDAHGHTLPIIAIYKNILGTL